jgi:Luciferase-like monooxygenase
MSNGLPPLTLGALDLSPVFRGMKPVDAIAMTLEIAPMHEAFGYSRYWLAEHHGPKVAHSSPELLVSIIAARTQRMHIGTAGILLRLHSPLKVAKKNRLLHSIFPDRIDLGIARGGTAPEQEILLRSGAGEEVSLRVRCPICSPICEKQPKSLQIHKASGRHRYGCWAVMLPVCIWRLCTEPPFVLPPFWRIGQSIPPTIDVDGRVVEERIVAGMVDPAIERTLLSAIRDFKYSPAKRDGVPIPSQLDIVIHIPS